MNDQTNNIFIDKSSQNDHGGGQDANQYKFDNLKLDLDQFSGESQSSESLHFQNEDEEIVVPIDRK